ncbi:MAG: hypothetical protein JWN95_121 [Frankiales bacterium]|nr:hypothetical protein [Frankiales bacterium]
MDDDDAFIGGSGTPPGIPDDPPTMAPLVAAMDQLIASADQLCAASDDDVIDQMRCLERVMRRAQLLGHAHIAQLERRGVASARAMRSTSTFLQTALRLSPYEAKRRVLAAQACGPRVSLTGQALPPLLPEVAAAHAAGAISAEHTNAIISTLDRFPTGLAAEHFDKAERILLDVARRARPREVSIAGARYLAHLDPDGVLADDNHQERVRELSLTQCDNGMWRLSGMLTAACGAQLAATLGPRSAPRPADADGHDPRIHPQRMHDALEELAGVAVRRKELSRSGAPATVIISMTEKQYLSRQGVVDTTTGQPLTVVQALKLADEAIIIGLVRSATGAVLKLGRMQRIATRPQTWALMARDKGCSFPDCDEPPERCQRHHIIPWWLGGPTDIDNLALLCHFHHRVFEERGWACLMKDGLPHWIPPKWLDPTQTPQLNIRLLAEAMPDGSA